MRLSDAYSFLRHAVAVAKADLQAARDTVVGTAASTGPILPALDGIDALTRNFTEALETCAALVEQHLGGKDNDPRLQAWRRVVVGNRVSALLATLYERRIPLGGITCAPPHDQPATWLTSFVVLYGGRWLALEEVPRHVADCFSEELLRLGAEGSDTR